ncbi:Biorientation of chromosomes in cell division protein 1-like protein [Tupaia chinensis]|uniref:Biorientation of chromosomes in cell division protein 1-like protein n=1 Tax=Tupaia chinensis TaxID=246437 RepID=L9L213_TUPCH|nr:Biorientation of chromosomes in cell division protein 1-like protein [Tupaia chinensis]
MKFTSNRIVKNVVFMWFRTASATGVKEEAFGLRSRTSLPAQLPLQFGTAAGSGCFPGPAELTGVRAGTAAVPARSAATAARPVTLLALKAEPLTPCAGGFTLTDENGGGGSGARAGTEEAEETGTLHTLWTKPGRATGWGLGKRHPTHAQHTVSRRPEAEPQNLLREKPAYQNLRQRVDNFVTNHLATHTWSPHLNKNQLRNNIRQQVLKSGMLESGIDRIISQVVDPKINHTFRPQVEKAVHEFLATLNHKEEASGSAAPDDEKPDLSVLAPGIPAPGPSANVASDAMSILETISSLNQEANAARASTEMPNAKTSERVSKKLSSQPSDASTDKERTSEDAADRERSTPDPGGDGLETAPKSEELSDLPCPVEESKNHTKENNSLILLNKDVQQENSDQKNKLTDKGEKKPDSSDKGEKKKEKKEKNEKKFDYTKRSEDVQKVKDEKQAKEKETESSKPPSEKSCNKVRAVEGTKEDCSPIDSDVDGLTDITVSSVHTSDLSSFEEETEEEVVMSDSMEEGEITSDDEEKSRRNKAKTQTSDCNEGKAKSVRHAYVHKPYLYSKYYSDSDDELTVEQRRQSIAKEKEERLLRRQINREKLEEKRKQKAEKTKSSKAKGQGKSSVDLEESPAKSLEPKAPRIKEVLKERKVLEKKVALSKKRRKDSRNVEDSSKKKQLSEEESKETLKTSELCEKEKLSSSKELKHIHAKSEPSKPARKLSECLHSTDENKNESKIEKEHKRRTSTPVVMEGPQEEIDTRDGRKQVERSETGTEEPQKQKNALKNEKHLKKDDCETSHLKSLPKKDVKSSKEKPEKEKVLLEDKPSTKHKYKGDSIHKTGEETELHASEKGLKVEENTQKQSQQIKFSSDEKAERKSKHRNERKLSILGKDGKPVSEYIIKTDENVRKENNKKERHLSAEKTKAEHKSRRSSESKIQKDSPSLKQHGTTLQRRSESYSEDKCDTDLTNLEHLKPEEVVHKEKRRTKSLLEEKLVLKSKSKSQGKQLKVVETEIHESVTKQAITTKPDKEKNTEENDSEKQRKSKVEDKPFEETGVEPALESAATLAHSTQKDSSHRAKLPLAKEKYKGDKDLGSSRLERKLSEGHKSRSLKHSNKDVKKKEEGKSDDKDGKEVDSNHEKSRGNSSVTEKKLSKRVCENRKGSLSQEMAKGEEKSAANTLSTSSSFFLQRPKKNNDPTLSPEQEPMEVDSESAVENVCDMSKPQDSSNDNSPQDTDSENMKQKNVTVLKDELRTSIADSKIAALACKSGRGTGVNSNSEKHTDHKSILTKKGHIQSAVSKPSFGEKEPVQQGTHEFSVDAEISRRMLPGPPSEDDKVPKNLKSITKATDEHVAQGDAALEHSADLEPAPSLSLVTIVPQKESHDSDAIPLVDKKTVLEDGTASAVPVVHSESPNRSPTGTESEVPRTSDSKAGGGGSMVDIPADTSKRHIPEGYQATFLGSNQGKGNEPLGSRLTGIIAQNEKNVSKEGGLMDKAKKEGDLGAKPDLTQTVRATVENGKKGDIAVDCLMGVSIEKGAKTLKPKHGRDPGEIGLSIDVERIGNSEVDTSAGGDAASSILPQRNEKPENVAAESGATEKSSVATSTEGKDKGVTLNPVKAGDATTTFSETGESEVALPCTSIEADEGFIMGAPFRSNTLRSGAEASEYTVFAAAEEGGGVVTEGFAESETFLTSTKEGESGECAVPESEDSTANLLAAQTVDIEANMSSAVMEEKDDAVTSAGSEEKCDGSSSRDSEIAEGATAFISEVESDGAVTSAGTEIRAGSISSEEVDGSQGNPRMGPKKETEGTVTCTGAGGRSDNFVICSVTGAGPQEGRMVSGADVVLVDKDAPSGTSASQEGDGSVNDGAEGESAVTSTGITEEDGEGPASCTGSEDSSEGFAISSESEENGESAMGSTVAKEVTKAPVVAAGPCDDEGIVTSTGAKEEDDEGEGVVTSTGRGNEVGHASTCTGIGEESEGMVTCESAEGDRQIRTAVEHVEAEAGAATMNANESNIDSMSSAEKEIKDAEICSSAKGIVESSVTSAISRKGEVAPILEGGQAPMTSAASHQSDSQLTRKGQEDTAISPGLVEGSYVLVSGAVPECEVDRTSPAEKEDEGVITSVENEQYDGRLAATASDAITHQKGLAGTENQGKGLLISTSTTHDYSPQLSAVVDLEGDHLSALRTEENTEGLRVSREEFEAPMPSAVSGDENQLTAGIHEEKDECAMISTSIGEEFEVPISSATTAKCGESQQPVATVNGSTEGSALVSTDDFEVPMPSAPTEVEGPLASTSKDEKDECALISTSSQEGDGSVNDGAEGESAVTSTGITEEDGEGPASCTGSEDSSEGFAISSESEENGESAMGSTVAKEVTKAPVVAAGPCDDEGIVTSTGAKEEDDEGEGVVTSTGRGNEVGHASTCTGIGEESEGMVTCESAEGDRQIRTAVEHVEAEAGAATMNANESNIDSMSSAEKEIKDAEICSSAKGIVESSVTSAISRKGEVAPILEGGQAPMTSAASHQSDSQLTRKGQEDTAISPGLVEGSYVLVSGAVPECEVDRTSPAEKEDEGVITSVENEQYDGRLAATASDAITHQKGLAGTENQGKGLLISTSTTHDYSPQLSAVVDLEGDHLSALRTEENTEGLRVSREEFEAPMPSAVSGDENQLTAGIHEEKDECAMISTSIGEEFEVPISSATTAKCGESQQPVATVNGSTEGSALVSTDDFEVPMPSAPTEVEGPLASTSKDEKDECALISTSIAEECEASIAGAVVEGEGERAITVMEEKDGSAVISTSSVEDCEGPVSSAIPQEEVHPSVTPAEEVNDTTMISTSTLEGREAVMVGAVPHDEDQPTAARVEDMSDAAIISTSTAECVPLGASLDRHGEDQPTANNPVGNGDLLATKASEREAPRPSPVAENSCQCPVLHRGHAQEAYTKGGPCRPSVQESSAGQSQPSAAFADEEKSRGRDHPGEGPFAGTGQKDSTDEDSALSSVQSRDQNPEEGTPGDSSTANCSTGRDLERSANSFQLKGPEQAPAPKGSVGTHCPAATNTGAKRADSTPPVRDAAEHPSVPPDQPEPEGDLNTTTRCITPSHTVTLPAARPTAPSAPKCEQDSTTKSDQSGRWTHETLTEQTGDGDRVTGSPHEEGGLGVPVSSDGNLCGLGNEDSSSNVLGELELKANLKTETFVPLEEEKRHEILPPPECSCGKKTSTLAELQREPSLVSKSLNVENSGSRTNEEIHNKSYNKGDISNGEKDSISSIRHHSVEASPEEEENSADLEELSKTSSKTNNALSRAVEEKDECGSGEAAGEKTEQNEEDSVKFQEVEQSPPSSKLKAMPTDESNKETTNLQERSVSNDDSEEKAVASVRRRGRKPKRSLTLSEDAESSEPERKRQKSVSEATEDKKDQESDEEEEEEEEEEPLGATTRSITRSEAQRSKTQLSPSAKRKREVSPPGARTRGQQRMEEAPAKKTKRQS